MLGEGGWFGHSSGSEYHMVVCGYLGGNPEIHSFFFSFFLLSSISCFFSSEAERNAKTREDLVSTTSGG